MPITLLDGILIGFTLVSAMLAMVRGLSREVLSIASWIAAAAAAYFFYPMLLPHVEPYIDNKQIAMVASAGIVFVIALIIVTIITMKIADWIIDSRVGALDRTLGFLYGAARGILVVAVGLLFFNWLAGANKPTWVTEAKSLPMLERIGTTIEGFLPDDPENSILKKLTNEEPDPAPETPVAPAPQSTAPGAGGEGPVVLDPEEGQSEQLPAEPLDESAPPAE
ncbi:CvpA family protein [Mesorhizobium sp. VNQ89]|uniref:CvpA family protein n=1 Tax=Mesorhizobium quangtriensis TaxID=3157709 RepID=UPI0032B708FD